MSALAAISLVQAVLVTVDGNSGQTCPSAREVEESLQIRMPGLVVPPDSSRAPNLLVLSLVSGAAPGAPGFTLSDSDGRVRLQRPLTVGPVPPANPDCAALAQTVALMVERYLRELQLPESQLRRAEPSQPVAALAAAPVPAPVTLSSPRPRWDVFAGSAWRSGGATGGPELRMGGARTLGASRRFLAAVTLGVSGSRSVELDRTGGDVRRFPLEAALLWRVEIVGRAELQLGVAAGLELFSAAAADDSSRHRVTRFTPVAAALGGIKVHFSRRFFVRAGAGAGFAPVRYEYLAASGEVALATERVYLRLDGQLGVSFE